jgi:hypothetical protein
VTLPLCFSSTVSPVVLSMCSATRTHTQRDIVSILPLTSSISPSLPFPPPSLQATGMFGNKDTALMVASYNGHTAAVEAIVAADPHPDHIRMTNVRSAGRGEGSVGGYGDRWRGGLCVKEGGGGGGEYRGGNLYSLPSPLLPAIFSPISHTVYMFTNPL